jgi:hypothetical protein
MHRSTRTTGSNLFTCAPEKFTKMSDRMSKPTEKVKHDTYQHYAASTSTSNLKRGLVVDRFPFFSDSVADTTHY